MAAPTFISDQEIAITTVPTNPPAQNATVPANTDCVLIKFKFGDGTATISNLVFGGTAATLIHRQDTAAGTTHSTAAYYVLAPAIGATTYDWDFSIAAECAITVEYWQNVNQTNPIGDIDSSTNFLGTVDPSLTLTATTNDAVTDLLAINTASTNTVATADGRTANRNNNTSDIVACSHVSGSANPTLAWTPTGGAGAVYTHTAFVLQGTGGGGGGSATSTFYLHRFLELYG